MQSLRQSSQSQPRAVGGCCIFSLVVIWRYHKEQIFLNCRIILKRELISSLTFRDGFHASTRGRIWRLKSSSYKNGIRDKTLFSCSQSQPTVLRDIVSNSLETWFERTYIFDLMGQNFGSPLATATLLEHNCQSQPDSVVRGYSFRHWWISRGEIFEFLWHNSIALLTDNFESSLGLIC